jgi:hypothetical protein
MVVYNRYRSHSLVKTVPHRTSSVSSSNRHQTFLHMGSFHLVAILPLAGLGGLVAHTRIALARKGASLAGQDLSLVVRLARSVCHHHLSERLQAGSLLAKALTNLLVPSHHT